MRPDVHLPSLNTLTGSPIETVVLDSRQQRVVLMGKLARFVLFCYIVLMFKPVMPIIADEMAHTFWLHRHLMEVHEVNGKFHIHTELSKAAHQSDNEKSNDLKYEVEQYLYTSPTLFKALIYTSPVSLYPSFSFSYPPCPHIEILSPPPQLLAPNKVSGAILDGSLFRA